MSEGKWWQQAVFYQIYPRSFADGNGDGIGDFPGIIARLDYLAELGIDAIWLSPHFPSPFLDCGYDISDYTAVAEEYGTLDDFKRFLHEAHARDIRVVLDLVLIPRMGINGASIASTIAYLAILTVTCLVIRFRLHIPVADLFLLRPSDLAFIRSMFMKPPASP